MLEPISLGQGRTHCPGLAADERGVVMGRNLALFFPDIARAVGFFRSYSRDVNQDLMKKSFRSCAPSLRCHRTASTERARALTSPSGLKWLGKSGDMARKPASRTSRCA